MKKLLITGGTSFIARNILPLLKRSYEVESPARSVLNVIDKQSVDGYLAGNKFDVLVHLAFPAPANNPLDKKENYLANIVTGFLNVISHSSEFEKILYVGSGAEYNKAYPVRMAREEDIGRTIPDFSDEYGFAKYLLNALARNSKNIYNLRVFGIYGPWENPQRLFYSAIENSLRKEPIALRQDCLFDYIYVEDLAGIIKWFVENEPKYHDYNAVSGTPVKLSEIAKMIAEKTGNNKGVAISMDGLNKEYTASSARLKAEMGNVDFTSLSEGIDRQIAWQKTGRN